MDQFIRGGSVDFGAPLFFTAGRSLLRTEAKVLDDELDVLLTTPYIGAGVIEKRYGSTPDDVTAEGARVECHSPVGPFSFPLPYMEGNMPAIFAHQLGLADHFEIHGGEEGFWIL